MSTEGEVVDKVVVGEEKKVDETKGDETKVETSPDEEAEARRMGWLPEDEYKGDKSRWRDAKSFLERGKNEVPIMRERMKHMDDQIKEFKQTIAEFAEYHTKVEQSAYQRAYNDLKAQQKVAVATADVDAFEKIEGQIEKLSTEIQKAPKIGKKEETSEAEVAKWVEKNPWAKDKEMESFAYSVGLHLRNTGNDKPMAEFLEDVGKEVKRLRPEKFVNARRSDPPAVETGGNIIRSKGKGFSDLDAEAKAAGEKFVKQGLFKSKDDYAKEYFKNLGE